MISGARVSSIKSLRRTGSFSREPFVFSSVYCVIMFMTSIDCDALFRDFFSWRSRPSGMSPEFFSIVKCRFCIGLSSSEISFESRKFLFSSF